jgi:cellulose synthase/poly-beta-1,6-N-acetylglucosamine synthase-like glycosyltransferase
MISPSPGEILVAVVVPAYNSGRTLADTLESAIAQTHRALDIVVVNDGSTDGTQEIAESFARRDSRVRVISVPNGGVARARNAGIAATRADYIAPLDSDDLWHPEKIARQLAAMLAGGSEIGFVYSPHRVIDEEGRVLYSSPVGPIEGWAFMRHLAVNFVSSGSSLLLRREAFEQVGGYDPTLRDQGKQGTEDYLLQLMIARTWRVAVVPDYLIAYRRGTGGMSSDPVRMATSRLACLEIVSRKYPDTPKWLLDQTAARAMTVILIYRLRQGQFGAAFAALRSAAVKAPLATIAQALHMAWRWFLKILRASELRRADRAGRLRRFRDIRPEQFHRPLAGPYLVRQLRLAALLEGPHADRSVPAGTDVLLSTGESAQSAD